MNTKNIIYAVVIIAIALFLLSRLDKEAPQVDNGNGTTPTSSIPEVTSADQKFGNENAEFVFIEYGDFQCPACAAYHKAVNAAKEMYQDEVLFVFRNFPLRNAHPNAQSASQAAEAAALHGKFWEMHDLLFERQKEWFDDINPKKTFSGYAEELGIDKETFERDFGSDIVEDKVNSDFNQGFSAGVRSTPSFYLNGQALDLPSNTQGFLNALGSQISGSN